MKKAILFTILLLTIGSIKAQQLGEIINGDFENWSQELLYESPTDWKSSNTDSYRGYPLITKSTDAVEGTYSTKLEIKVNGDDTLQSYIYHGSAGDNGPDKGIPYTTTFSDVAVSYKSDLLGNDTLNLLIIRFVLGSIVGMEVLPVADAQNSSWVTDTISVSPGVQDSLFIGFVIGSVEDGILNDGSWAMVDNVEMLDNGVAVTPLPNPGFENWTSTFVENPDNWFTLNELLTGVQMSNAIKSIDAHQGTYAIEMTTVQPQSFGNDTISSFISLGAINFTEQMSPFTPIPYIATPAVFSGAYKYSPVNGDQAGISIRFYQDGLIVCQHDEGLTSQAAYTTFSSALTFSGAPDSVVFMAYSGDNPGSVLKLDDLQFSGGDVSIENINSSELSIYPNPASNFVNIEGAGDNFSYVIYDITGKELSSQTNVVGKQTINVSDFHRGSYFIKIIEGDNIIVKKLIIQ